MFVKNNSCSTSSWYEFGAQGETRVLTNNSGASTDTYNFNGYGELIASSGSTTNPYRYGGKYGYYTETYTGLVLATQRWYSPNMMRWISRDPIGYEGGVNLYEYVGGRPIRFVDPSGLRWACAKHPATGHFVCTHFPDKPWSLPDDIGIFKILKPKCNFLCFFEDYEFGKAQERALINNKRCA